MLINKNVNIPPHSTFPSIWESTLDDPMDSHSIVSELEPHVIDDTLDVDDFLIIGDDIDDETSLVLNDDYMDDAGIFSKDMMFRPDPPVTPPPEDVDNCTNHFVQEVTPDKPKDIVRMEIDDIRLPGLEELQEEYDLSCKRLGETIWHAEMTRRWRARFSEMDDAGQSDEALGKATDFLTGAKPTLTNDLEVSRRRLWAMIHSPPPKQF